MKFLCDICNNSYKSNSSLKRHKIEKHESIIKYKCEKCEKRFKRKENLERHLKNIHYNLKLKCFICDNAFYDEYYKKKHLKSKHNYYKCELCLNYFDINSDNHNCLRIEKRLKCHICKNKYFKRSLQFFKHLISRHKINDNQLLNKLYFNCLQKYCKFYSNEINNLNKKNIFKDNENKKDILLEIYLNDLLISMIKSKKIKIN